MKIYLKFEFEDNLLDIKCSYKEDIIKVYSKMEKVFRLDEGVKGNKMKFLLIYIIFI